MSVETKVLAPGEPMDEGQRRMVAAAERLFQAEAVRARLEEFDQDAQPERRKSGN